MEGITVNKAHGSVSGVRRAKERFGKVVESMEGAAVFYVCRMENTNCLQVKAVSNLVEKRRRDKWKIREAVDALSGFTGLFLLEWALVHARSSSDSK
jgi:futalosine hydrolase